MSLGNQREWWEARVQADITLPKKAVRREDERWDE
jgi:hypothetical protein